MLEKGNRAMYEEVFPRVINPNNVIGSIFIYTVKGLKTSQHEKRYEKN